MKEQGKNSDVSGVISPEGGEANPAEVAPFLAFSEFHKLSPFLRELPWPATTHERIVITCLM